MGNEEMRYTCVTLVFWTSSNAPQSVIFAWKQNSLIFAHFASKTKRLGCLKYAQILITPSESLMIPSKSLMFPTRSLGDSCGITKRSKNKKDGEFIVQLWALFSFTCKSRRKRVNLLGYNGFREDANKLNQWRWFVNLERKTEHNRT